MFAKWGKKKINRERNIIFNLLRRFFINNRKKKRKNMKRICHHPFNLYLLSLILHHPELHDNLKFHFNFNVSYNST